MFSFLRLSLSPSLRVPCFSCLLSMERSHRRLVARGRGRGGVQIGCEKTRVCLQLRIANGRWDVVEETNLQFAEEITEPARHGRIVAPKIAINTNSVLLSKNLNLLLRNLLQNPPLRIS